MFQLLFRTVLLLGIAIAFPCFNIHAQEMLRSENIQQIMQQILTQHLETHELTIPILKRALHSYVQEFDPGHLYFLNTEIEPFINPTDQQMQTLVAQYKNNDYSAFWRLNHLIEHAIERARMYRQQMGTMKLAPPIDYIPENAYTTTGYAKNIDELKLRMWIDYLKFTAMERSRYGNGKYLQNDPKNFMRYEKAMREEEDPYLSVDRSGKPRSTQQIEHLFTLRVLKALAGSLDAHTKFFDPREAYQMRMRLAKEVEGIGIVLQKQDQNVVISALIEGSPAAKNGGLHIGDQLISVNGKPATANSLEEILEVLRDDKQKTVAITVKHMPEGKLAQISIERAEIPVNEGRASSYYEAFGNGIIGVIRLDSFYRNDDGISSEIDVSTAIKTLDHQGNLRGLVLDLRENMGGYLMQAVKVAGLFITKGVVVISKYSNGKEQVYRDLDNKKLYKGPLIVLTSKKTASAAELLAQALQDYGLALVVGDEHTYGKGTIQSQTVTQEGSPSYFKVTVGKYYTVSGKTPQLQGVQPDIVVPGPWNDQPIGEVYLEETIQPDQIESFYKDDLSDVNSIERMWMMRYYTPQIEPHTTFWHDLLPTLSKNSNVRLANQQKQAKAAEELNALIQDGVNVSKKTGKKAVGVDPQLDEVLNIVKDMIQLEGQMRKAPVQAVPIHQ